MNKEQVSALSDVELNSAMLNICMDYWKTDKDILKSVQGGKFNYLADYNITMPLAVENKLSIEIMDSTTRCEDPYEGKVASNKNPLRAICEVLVMIKLEEI